MASTLHGTEKPLFPCFAHPDPTSRSPTPFTYTRRCFTLKSVPDSFPYHVPAEGGFQIHYFEFRGQSPPPTDVGQPGDVWLDLTPGGYALYACMHTPGQWMRWPGPRKAKKQMFAHPLLPGRYLWCTRKHVLWYTCDGIRKSASLQMRGEEDDFGRTRYRTVGPMGRGGARNTEHMREGCGEGRVPLRTAAEAIAKILEMEEEERKGGREPTAPRRKRSAPPPAKRARTEDGEGEGAEGEGDEVSPEPTPAPVEPPPQPPPTLQQYISHPFPIQPAASSSSSLSQALGPPPSHSYLQPAPAASLPQTPSSAGPRPSPSASTLAPSPTTPTPTATPAPAPPHPSRMLERTRFLEQELIRTRDETRRLSDENRRLSAENARLADECARLRGGPAGALVPELAGAVREAMAGALGSRVGHLLQDVQEQRAARLEAERKLAEFQEQLKKITQAFQLGGVSGPNPGGGGVNGALHTPGPSPRMGISDAG